jgi:hypothetical protein
MARCSICYTVLGSQEAHTTCPACQTDYHSTCWNEIGGCGSYGCTHAAVAQKPPLPARVGGGWGDTKECPACTRPIASSLLVCTCGARFPWADPMTRAEYDAHVGKERAIRRARIALIWMFVLSLVGVTAPLVGPIAGIYAHRKRDQLLGTGGTYLAMGYGSAAIGGFYALLLALVATGH